MTLSAGDSGDASRRPPAVSVGIALGLPFLIAIVLLFGAGHLIAAAAVALLGSLMLWWARLARRRRLEEETRAGRALAERERALGETRARLAEAERRAALAGRAASLAHDFKNLLTGIQGYARLLLDRVGPGDPIRRQLAAIEDAAARAGDLASRLQAIGTEDSAATSTVPTPPAPPAGASAPVAPVPGAVVAGAAAGGSGGRPATILVVDDEPTILALARDVLELEGYTVLVARNGEEALRTYQDRSNGITLVLLDLTMPVMGGLECLRRLRAFDPAVRVVIISGFTNERGAADVLREGALDCLQKPYEIQALARTVAAALALQPAPTRPAPALKPAPAAASG